MSLTPIAARPVSLTSATARRMRMPCSVITRRCSVSVTDEMPTTGPFFSLTRTLMTPDPPRVWWRYSATSVLLPYPFSVTARSVPVSSTRSIATTTSSPLSSIPLTPVVSRPIARVSVSENLIPMPSCVPRKTCRVPSVICAESSSSPSSSLIAMMPFSRGFPYAESTVFLMRPRFVANSRYRSSGNVRVVAIAAMRSPSSRARRFTSALPRVAGPPEGTS